MNTVDWKKPIQLRVQAYASDLETRKDRIYPARFVGSYGDRNNPHFVVAWRQPGTEPFDKSEILHTSGASGQIQRGMWVENIPAYTYSGAWYSPSHSCFFYSPRFNNLSDVLTQAKLWECNILFYIKWDIDGTVADIILPHLIQVDD